jgi:hypothetical protein
LEIRVRKKVYQSFSLRLPPVGGYQLFQKPIGPSILPIVVVLLCRFILSVVIVAVEYFLILITRRKKGEEKQYNKE